MSEELDQLETQVETQAEPPVETEKSSVEQGAEWFGVDVSSLAPEQVNALDGVRKQMLQGLNAKFRTLAEERKSVERYKGLIDSLESDPEALDRVLHAVRATPQSKQDQAQKQPDDDEVVTKLLESIEDDQRDLVKSIIDAAAHKASKASSQWKEEMETAKRIQVAAKEQAEFVANHPSLDHNSEEFNEIEFNDFKEHLRALERRYSGIELEDAWILYKRPSLESTATKAKRVVDHLQANVRKATEMPSAGASTVSKAKGFKAFDELYEKYKARGVV